jgi:hypothetical protein
VFSKLDLAIAAGVAAALLWIEHDHRILIGTPSVEAASQAAAICPENDSVPFSADCIAFIEGTPPPDMRDRPRAAARTLPARSGGHAHAVSQTSPCPASNENTPYSADCIAFLSGWYWQAN